MENLAKVTRAIRPSVAIYKIQLPEVFDEVKSGNMGRISYQRKSKYKYESKHGKVKAKIQHLRFEEIYEKKTF